MTIGGMKMRIISLNTFENSTTIYQHISKYFQCLKFHKQFLEMKINSLFLCLKKQSVYLFD